MNPGLMQQAIAAKTYYRVSNPKAHHVVIRRITGRQIHVHGGEFCDEFGYLRDGSRACMAFLDNADAVIELEYAPNVPAEKRFYFYWATVGVYRGVPSVWMD